MKTMVIKTQTGRKSFLNETVCRMKLATMLAVVMLMNASAKAQVSPGDTITTDTVLTNDLLNCPSRGLIIGADNITLDGNGHLITGMGSFAGIVLENRKGVTIKNCRVEGFGTGIRLSYGGNNNLIDNHTNQNYSSGIYLVSSYGNTLSGNIANNNADLDGDHNIAHGIFLVYGSGNTLTGNTANHNGYSIYLFGSDDNTLDGNTANQNRRGIYLASTSSHNDLISNTANDNDYGIYLLNSASYNDLTSNEVNNNGTGIYIMSSWSNLLTANSIGDNSRGIYLLAGTMHTIWDNTFSGNSAREGGGSRASSTSNVVFTNNTFKENTAAAGGGAYA